jgi:hypothetical protein
MKNKYCYRLRLSEYKFRQLLECFSDDLNTIITSKITGISRQSVTQYFNWFRERIYQLVVNDKSMLEGEFCWNHRNDNIYKVLLNEFRSNPIKL